MLVSVMTPPKIAEVTVTVTVGRQVCAVLLSVVDFAGRGRGSRVETGQGDQGLTLCVCEVREEEEDGK